ncbi:MAG: uracil-DNA glycosylase [Synergistaceae bacterium]|nr:uracil-DNA glycosylase [Synergistaceae bacterium]
MLSRESNYNQAYKELEDKIKICEKCGLCKTRNKVVIGEGKLNSSLMLVGEGPGEDEDRTGRPFVGRAGQLLDRILSAVKIDRQETYIANVVKCRPPENRTPLQSEMLACGEFLEAQIALVKPKILVALGNTPLKFFLRVNGGITKFRGQWQTWRGIPLLPMFHPSYLLREESRAVGSPKELTWRDVKNLKSRLDNLN